MALFYFPSIKTNPSAETRAEGFVMLSGWLLRNLEVDLLYFTSKERAVDREWENGE
jgi:hypothetical protein